MHMRFSLALVSGVWTSRRCLFTYGFSGWNTNTYKQSHITSFQFDRSSQTMEVDHSKRPRIEQTNLMQCRATMHTSSETLHNKSPYERNLGKIISICSKCHGEGKVRAPLSKKARARRKQMQQNDDKAGLGEDTNAKNTIEQPPPQMKACHVCGGSGLIASPPSPDSSRETKHDAAEQSSPQVQPNIAIVGGGIGGIALAAALQHRNIPCTVYERDISFEERSQGYGLTVQQGARALRSLGFFSLTDNDSETADDSDKDNPNSDRTESDSSPKAKFGIHSTRHVVHKPDGTVVGEWGMKVWGGRFEKKGRHAKRQNAHISRQNLRKLLMGMVRPGTIKWGHKFLGYTEQDIDSDHTGNNNRLLNLTFRRRRDECEGSKEECEEIVSTNATILVGCDGIRSVVRANKLGNDVAPLRYLDCIVILGIVTSPADSLTDGETVFQTADGTTRLYAMPFAQPGEEARAIGKGILEGNSHMGLSMWQLSFPMDESDAKQLSKLGPSALKAEALKRCGEWHHPIPELLDQTPEDLITGYPCYDRALVEAEMFRRGHDSSENNLGNSYVTMLGDAAHPMVSAKAVGLPYEYY